VQLKTHFLELGGTTVCTPALRTVIQADGDVLCFFDEDRTRGDDVLWRQHLAAVEECAGRLAAAITTVEVLLHRVSVAASVVLSTAIFLIAQRPWVALMGVAIACASYGAAWAGRVTWHALAARNERHASVIGRTVSWAILTLAAAGATALGIDVLAPRDLIIVAASLVPAILGSWALHWLTRRFLGLVST
jgi:hypothetical protein